MGDYYTKSEVDALVSPKVPFYTADGTYDPVDLVGGELVFFRADGIQDNIPVSL
jgi:hypothetical protein